jgi:uncharacterized protein YjbI with pentapeptide repeats
MMEAVGMDNELEWSSKYSPDIDFAMNEPDNFPVMNTSAIQVARQELPDLKIYGYQAYEKLSEEIDAGRASYLGIDISLDRLVVIKEWRRLAGQTPPLDYDNYLLKIDRLQQIDHPSIPRYLNSFATPTGFCVVREYQSGISLAELGDLPASDIRLVADAVLKILTDLHHLTPAVIHQNIKPENIIFISEPTLKIYLVDFGLHSAKGANASIGKPGFTSPPHLLNQSLTSTSDIYSLGVSLICLLTGTATAQVHDLFDRNDRIQFQQLLPPNTDPQLIKSLEMMVEPQHQDRAINPNTIVPVKNHRPSSNQALEELRMSLDDISAPKKKVNWVKWGIGSAVLIGLGLGARLFIFPDDGEPSPADIAKNQAIAEKANFAASDRGQLLKDKRCPNCNFSYQNFAKAELSGAIVSQSIFNGADFSKANMNLAIFKDADLSGANFTKANLQNAAFYGAKFMGTNLVGANLSNAKLVYAKLKGAWLRDANLSRADLKFAEIQQVDLTRANLTGADLSNADLSYTNLRSAILTGAKLEGTILTGATMPDGSTHP